ncbi:MAG: hypothetical protein FWD61_14075 [Phycisphaerales bacterium]|nr:hypothetical protein [Phycisphaerales bacterium]
MVVAHPTMVVIQSTMVVVPPTIKGVSVDKTSPFYPICMVVVWSATKDISPPFE